MADYMDPDPSPAEGAEPTPADKVTSNGRDLSGTASKAAHWQRELAASEKWMQKFTRSARICERAYMDTETKGDDVLSSTTGKVNLFWSNVQVVMSAIYGRMPAAEVDRKFGDYDDDVARVAGIIMQRVLNSDIQREYDDTNAAMRDAVQDRFIVGMGQVWCRYEVETEEVQTPQLDMMGQPMVGDDGQPVMTTDERIVNEDAATDYVYWDDFRYSPCRRWRDCRWVARRCYMSKEKLAKRFSLTEEQLGMIPMQSRTPTETGAWAGSDDVLKATPFTQAAVWEIWDRDSNTACWFVMGCAFVLDEVPDPLELDDFFPCPQPIVATTLTKAFLPRADYAMAQDLYKELDNLNARISRLTQAIKAAGVYDKAASPVKSILTTAVENALVPVDSWAGFAERGGLRGAMDFLPIEQFANALVQLQQRKAQVERDLYEVLGISDIMRGASVASETLGAQQLKVQYGGARLANLQGEVARFVAGVMKIRANIVSKFFQPETLIRRSLIDRTPDAPQAQQAIAMLKDYGSFLFNVNVTSDSLAAPDWEAEKSARTEFMGAASNYLMAAGPMVAQAPELGAFLIKLLQWGAAGFKGAKTIEGVLDQAAQQIQQKAAQPPAPPPPSPSDKKDEAAAKKSDADAARSLSEAVGVDLANLMTAAQLGLQVPTPSMSAAGAGQPQMPPGAQLGQMPPGGPGSPPGAPNGGPPMGGMPPGGPGAPGGVPQPAIPAAQPPAPLQ